MIISISTTRRLLGLCLAGVGVLAGDLARSKSPSPMTRPHFIGEVDVQFTSDGRHMKLLHDFSFVDSDGSEWIAPAGMVTDGASIPPFLWSTGLGPFEGRYRGPAVLHDWYCDHRTRPCKAVDTMFYHAMLAAGVDRPTAQVMFVAVYIAGPKWDLQAIDNEIISERLAYRRDLDRQNGSGTRDIQLGDSDVVPVKPPANAGERVADLYYEGHAKPVDTVPAGAGVHVGAPSASASPALTVFAIDATIALPEPSKLSAAMRRARSAPETDAELEALADAALRP